METIIQKLQQYTKEDPGAVILGEAPRLGTEPRKEASVLLLPLTKYRINGNCLETASVAASLALKAAAVAAGSGVAAMLFRRLLRDE